MPSAVHTIPPTEQLGLPILSTASQLTFSIKVILFKLFNKLKFSFYIYNFSQKMFSHTTPVLTCVNINLTYPKSRLTVILKWHEMLDNAEKQQIKSLLFELEIKAEDTI